MGSSDSKPAPEVPVPTTPYTAGYAPAADIEDKEETALAFNEASSVVNVANTIFPLNSLLDERPSITRHHNPSVNMNKVVEVFPQRWSHMGLGYRLDTAVVQSRRF
jgi:hypothetical protein